MRRKAFRNVAVAICALLMLFSSACTSTTGAATSAPTTANETTAASTTTATAAPTTAATSTAAEQATSSATTDPLGKYDKTVTLTAARTLDSSVKFDTSNPLSKSIEENQWSDAYKAYLNIDIDYIWTAPSDEYDTKWNTSIASGDIPDIGVVDATIYKELLDGGFVQDMTDTYNKYACPEYKQWNVDDNKATMSYMTYDGKLYGLPVTGAQPDGGSLLYIRKDWLDKIGKQVPKTIGEVTEDAQLFMKAKLGGDNTYGIYMDKNVNSIEGFLNGYGAYYNVWMDDGAGKLKYSSIQPEMKPALLALQDLYKKGILSQDFVTKTDEDIGASKVGIIYGRFWTPLGGMQTSIEKGNAQWIVLVSPTKDGSNGSIQGSATPSSFIFVKKGIEHPEAVLKVIALNENAEVNKFRPAVDEMTGDQVFDESQKLANDGVLTYLFMFASVGPPWKNLKDYELCSDALVNGPTDKLDTGVAARNYYNAIKKDDTSGKTYGLIFGVDSAFARIKEMKESNRILVDADQKLQTKTQISSGATILAALDSAMLRIVMGEDISVFDQAVDAWKAGGGSAITDELNQWYASKK